MTFVVFGYNFPHWKTQMGLFNMFMAGFIPDMVILQDKKELNFKQSKYRITPFWEYLQDPKQICKKLGFRFMVCNHDDYKNEMYYESDYGVILGARILKKETIERYKGILNIHPGILPGNRGLDNLKWSLIKGLPIGVTAHFIDDRIDMGEIITKREMFRLKDESIRDLYIRQRNEEQLILIEAMSIISNGLEDLTPVEYSEKFPCVENEPNYNDLI